MGRWCAAWRKVCVFLRVFLRVGYPPNVAVCFWLSDWDESGIRLESADPC